MLEARPQACRGEPAAAMHEIFLPLGVGETARQQGTEQGF